MRLGLLLGVLIAVTACSKAAQLTAAGPRSMKDVVFLTRNGCVNTETMRANLDEALTELGWSKDYQFIDTDTLKPTDPRGGYGTPTVLHASRDLFDMPEPPVPHPAPT